MQSDVQLDAVDTHTGGMPTRILLSGQNHSKAGGETVAEQRDRFRDQQDDLRELLMQEPRGHQDMFGAVPTVPSMDEADMGLFFMDHGGYLDMCGHGTMGVVTAFIETNRLEPDSEITIETPAGPVTAFPEMENGRVERVGLQNVQSYVVDSISVPLETAEDDLELDVDIVFAGNYFAMVDNAQLAMDLDTSNTYRFIEHGLALRETINEAYDVTDPRTGEDAVVELTEFYDSSGPVDRNIVIFADGAVDRSPCGTGTCAKMTLLYDKGKLDLEEAYPHESIIGTRFEGVLKDVETKDGVDVTTPEVWGSAHIVGTHTFLKDEADPTPSFSLFES